MSLQTLPEASSSAQYPSVECRVWERYPCGLQATCQPIAARADNDLSWPAQIRDLSVGGMGLVLRRRFERGVGLAIEIPRTGSASADTLLARVVHTTSLPGGLWLHGCAFVSELSEDELKRLLRLGQAETKSVRNGTSPPYLVQEVTLEGVGVQCPPRLVRRLHVKGTWPPAAGTVLKIWFGKNPQAHAQVRVQRCYQEAGRWFVTYTFVDPPGPELLHALAQRS